MRFRRVLNTLDNLLLAVVVAAGGWWGVDRYVLDDGPPPPPAVAERAEATPAERLLATLDVKGRAPKTGYERKRFGVGAIDPDRNGCDYRNDTLRRDLTAIVMKPGTNDCVVLAGTLADPYTGRTIPFVRGPQTSGVIEIDHVVALSDAWQKGAQQWDDATLLQFSNDPDNLLAVDRTANRQKGDGDAATWLPRNRRYRCAYVTKQIEVKAKYGLWVTPKEHDAMARELARCPTASAGAG